MKGMSKIELATYEDLQGITNLLESVNVPTNGIDPDFTNFYIIRDEQSNKIIGCVGLEIFTGTALLRSLAVDPNYQGKNIGSNLVTKLIDEAALTGLTTIYVCTAKVPQLFLNFGFYGIDLDDVPEEIRSTILFTEGCPKIAAFMKKRII